ncbi:transposable element Tcb1 transposase [Trichonephila clavipes]|nr:transposable element Tcb1 transposase [Trichonephila clavipes]
MGAEFLFMNDNAPPHRANIVYECLQSEDITRMVWPAYSPDLNPIGACVGYAWPTNCSPSTSHLSTGTRRALFDEWANAKLKLCLRDRRPHISTRGVTGSSPSANERTHRGEGADED